MSMERKFVDAALGGIEADGTFAGYASLFGQADLGRDVVERGAFAASLRRRGAAGIRMLFQHDPAQPVGRWLTIREDEKGLFVKGRIARDAAKAREVLALMRDGALDGLSIGFRTVRARREAGTGLRRILEADLWEISIVTFPMLPGARVESVKNVPSARELERRLTRDAQLSRAQARAVIARGYAGLKGARDAAEGDGPDLAERVRQAAKTIQNKDIHR
jgi:HK97 family phage prohead protease